MNPSLEFQVTLEQCQPSPEEVFHFTLTPQSLEEEGGNCIQTPTRSQTQLSPLSPSKQHSTPNMLVRLEQKIEKDALKWKQSAISLGEKYPAKSASGKLPKEEEPTATSSVSRAVVAGKDSSSPRKQPLNNKIILNALGDKTILFVPLGRTLTLGRIKTLQSVVQRKGWKVVSGLDSAPSHIVVDVRVAVQPLARALGFTSTLRLAKAIQERGITLVKPSWITNNKGSQLKTPKLTELYNGLVSEIEPIKKRKIAVRRKTDSVDDDSEGGSVCEVPATGDKTMRNLEISAILERLAKAYQEAPIPGSGDEFRAYTFHLVAGRLRFLDFELTKDPAALEKLKIVPGIGDSSREIISEWLRTRQLPKRITLLETEERRVALCNLQKIWGVGPATALRLYMLDFTDINRIRQALRQERLKQMDKNERSTGNVLSSFLTRNQLVGVECYEDFQDKMSRSEVEEIFQICSKELSQLLPNAKMEIMGSYRRGKHACGDADLLIYDPNWNNCTPNFALGRLVMRLHRGGYIKYHLTDIPGISKDEDVKVKAGKEGENTQFSSGSDTTTIVNQQKRFCSFEPYPSSQTYMGVFISPTIPGKRRRIDIKFYPYRERAFATLYFTGCGWFNRSMRLWSKRKLNLRLNDHGIFPYDSKQTAYVPQPHENLPYPDLNSEFLIFEKLGLVFKEPRERNCFDDVVSKSCGESVAQLKIDDRKEFYEEQKFEKMSPYKGGYIFKDD